MGREIKRVPADFDFPLGDTWHGFLNPHYRKCDACDGHGDTASARALSAIVWRLMVAGDDSTKRPDGYDGRPTMIPNYPGAPAHHRRHWPHPYTVNLGINDPGDSLHEVTAGLAGRSPVGRAFGHDACDHWAATRKIITAAGLPDTWGTCPVCGGEGLHPDAAEAYNAWTETPPPTGPAYQVWQTVSEGGPVSPPFLDPDDLADWMVANDTSITRDTSREQWLAFIRGPGWAPSMVSDGSVLISGVAASGKPGSEAGPTAP